MSNRSSPDFDNVQQAFQQLWGGDRIELKAAVSNLVSRLAAIEAKVRETVGWEEAVAELTCSAETATRSMGGTAAEDVESLGQALLLCAITLELGLQPSARKLSTFRSLAGHSWVLENSMSHVILVAMSEDETTRLSWLELLKGCLPQPVPDNQWTNDPLNPPSWGDVFRPNRSQASLDALIPPLTVLLKVDSEFAFAYLESLRDWEFVEHALLLSGAVSTLERWSTALAQASRPFTASGDWTGSVVGLLLMKHAQEELLLRPGEHLFGRSVSEPTWSSEIVIGEVRKRPDWLSMLRALSVGVFRDYIATADSAHTKHNDRMAHRLSRLEQLLEGMPSEVRQTRPEGELPAGYPAWFEWYERALEVHWHLEANPSSTPTAQVIALYGRAVMWDSANCNDVRLHRAQIGYGKSELIIGRLDLYLGAALTAAPQAAKTWGALWQQTFNLREMVEFGGHSEDDAEAWQDRGAASSLTELVLRLGIAVADMSFQSSTQLVDRYRSESSSLLCLLQTCAMEMAEIEVRKTDVWTHALRYVLLLWGRCRMQLNDVDEIEFAASAPDERQLIEYLSTDPMELLFALTACARNGIADQTLARQLASARIDSSAALSQAKLSSETGRPRQRLSEESISLAERLRGLVVPA